MDTKDYYNTCEKCGRPIQYATEPKCNYCDSCMSEYCGCKLGRIKEIEPTCDSTAVIPSITVESVEGITNLANCLVHVNDINTTFYVDDKHRVMITWAGPVDIPGYDMENNPNGYRDQIVTDVENETAVIYDKHGNGYLFGITPDNLQTAINNKLDEMATDGTLENIIATYMDDVTHTFDTVADMKNSTELTSGAYAQTLGFHSINDGGGALYKITDTGTSDEMYTIAVSNNLYANLIIQDYITPEILGAYGDNTHDDTVPVQECLNNTNYMHSVLSKKYKISTGLTVADYKVVDGGGSIYSTTSCFVIDGRNHLNIKDLKLYPQLHAIHIKSDSGHCNYNVFNNIFCYGANTVDSKGLFIEVTNSYINEQQYHACVFWNFKYAICALNEDNTSEMTKHIFYDCSSETSRTAGQYIKNGSVFCFYNCRHVEATSNIWITEGTCDELLIVGGPAWFNNANNMQFSDATNGQIIGGLRYTGIGNNRSERNGNIVNGKVVPWVNAISTARVNVGADMTITYPAQIYLYYNFNSAVDCTLTLPSECYGGEGKINEFYVRTTKENNTSTVKIGTFTKILPAGSTHVYRFSLNTTGGGTSWFVEDISNAV